TAGEPWSATTRTPLGTPPHLYASWARKVWVVGVAANAPFAGGVRWADDSPLRFVNLESKPTFFRISPFFGAATGPVRFALGPHVDVGSLEVRQATDHVVEEGSAHLLLRGTGIGADLSVFVTLESMRLGLSYKSRTALGLTGEADFEVPGPFQHQLPDQVVTARWTLPDRLALGQAFAVGGASVFVDETLTLWSVNDALAIDFTDPATPDVNQVNAWQDALALRLGVERPVGESSVVRGGGYLDGLGLNGRGAAIVPTDTLGPSSPDGLRVGATVGAGARLSDHTRGDAFLEGLVILRRAATGAEVPAASYGGWAAIAGFTVGFAGDPPPPSGG
ncbi:MAG: hypothetical protein ABMA64_13675, partial [Myxococcota bacterium]